jgi:hypothetical protein
MQAYQACLFNQAIIGTSLHEITIKLVGETKNSFTNCLQQSKYQKYVF